MRRRELLIAAGIPAIGLSSIASAADPRNQGGDPGPADAPSAGSAPGARRATSVRDGGRDCITLDDLLRRRKMVRRYRPDPVPDDVVQRLIAAAVRAPSAGHTQPWAFVVVRDTQQRRALAEAALGQMFVAEAPVLIVACAELERSRGKYGERGDQYAVIDTAFACSLLLLAVVEEGLGACFVGAFHDAEVARILALPRDVKPIAVISIGRPDESPSPRKLRRPREVVHRERWT